MNIYMTGRENSKSIIQWLLNVHVNRELKITQSSKWNELLKTQGYLSQDLHETNFKFKLGCHP